MWAMPHPTRRHLMLTAAAALAPVPAAAAPAARLIHDRWARFGRGQGPDHGALDRLLARHVTVPGDGIARVDYAALDAGALERYLDAMQAADPGGMTARAAFAYWVNLYNAATVRLVRAAYPVDSIRDIGGSLFRPGPWREPVVQVAGQALSLDDIEHGILRPVWRDPRIHYAVNCAALGCPNLVGRAWTPGRLGQMLEAAARAYVNHPRGARAAGNTLEVSSVYDWYKTDFGGSDGAVIEHLRGYAAPGLADRLAGRRRIDAYRYDWKLNDTG